MAIGSPNYDTRAASGGFMDKIFQNLPRPFSRDPKQQLALTLSQTGSLTYPYISVKDQTLYFHSVPLNSPGIIPEVSFDLTQMSFTTLGTQITNAGIGYTATASGSQDGTTASLLLDFTDYRPAAGETTQLHTATARSWKFFHPIANVLNEAGSNTDTAEKMMYLPYAAGFWLDELWGDWLNIPRLPGMTDDQYVGHLIWTLKTPQVTNIALKAILSEHYKVPINVADAAVFQFLVSLDPSLMNTLTTQALSPVVNKIKPAGTTWLVDYKGAYTENFKPYFSSRTGKEFSKSDVLGLSMSFIEGQYGYEATGFMANVGMVNDTTTGFGYKLKDAYVMTLQQNYTETKAKPTENAYSQTITLTPSEAYKGTAVDAFEGAQLNFTEGFKYRAPVGCFIFNQSTVNDTPIGGGDDHAVKESGAMYYNNPSDPSYTTF